MNARVALRGLKRNPRFSWTVIVTLALGIGVSTAAFSVVHGVLLAPLPYNTADELVVVRVDDTRVGGGPRWSLSRATFRQIESVPSLASVDAQFAYYANVGSERLDQVVMASRVTPGFLDNFGVTPLMGRTLRPDDRTAVVLSHGLWQSYFGGRSDIVGQTLRLEDVNPLRDPSANGAGRVTVVGVMPRAFWAPASFVDVGRRTDLWIPLLGPEAVPNERTTVLHVYGRLTPGASLARVRDDLDRATERLAEEDPVGWATDRLTADPLVANHLGAARTRVLLLGAAGLTLLVIVLMNAVSLLLARGMTRGSEYSLRTALGASRARLLRSAVTENAVMVGVATPASVLLAHALVSAFASFAPADIPRLEMLAVNGPALLVALLTSVACVLVFSASLMLLHGQTASSEWLRQARASRPVVRFQGVAVGGQAGLTVLLLVGMGLTMRALRSMTTVDPGVGIESRLTFRLVLPQVRYPTAADKVRAMTAVHEAITRIPGVRASGSADQIPPVQGGGGGPLVSDVVAEPVRVGIRTVTRGYLQAIDLSVLEGRAFDASDDVTSERVALVNETLARALWSGVSPLGRVIRSPGGAFQNTVVGIVPDLPSLLLGEPLRPEVYVLHEQVPWNQHWAVVHVEGDPTAFMEPVRAAVRSVDPDLPVSATATQRDRFAAAAATPRFLGAALSLLTVAGLFLVTVGTVAVLTQVVSGRLREIAIRLAVGASPLRVTRHFALQGAAVTGFGALLGAVASVPAGAVLASQLYGVSGVDLCILLAGVVAVVVVTLGATLPLLMKAGRTDPSIALRSE